MSVCVNLQQTGGQDLTSPRSCPHNASLLDFFLLPSDLHARPVFLPRYDDPAFTEPVSVCGQFDDYADDDVSDLNVVSCAGSVAGNSYS